MADQTGQEGNNTQSPNCAEKEHENLGINTENKLKRSRNDGNLSEDDHEHENRKRSKQENAKSEINELKSLMYDLAIEVKDLNDKVFDRIDTLERNFTKNIIETITKMTNNKIKTELDKVKNEFKTELITVNSRIDGMVYKLKTDIQQIRNDIIDNEALPVDATNED